MKEQDKTRINFDLQPELKSRLDILKDKTRAASVAEVVRRALALYWVVSDHYEEGGKLMFRHQDGTEETVRLVEFEK